MTRYDLQKLINYFEIALQSTSAVGLFPFDQKQSINQLKLDSRLVKSGDVFIALKGHTVDGRDFISKAIDNGAIAVLVEAESKLEDKTVKYYAIEENKIPLIYIDQLASKLSAFANDFYGYPSEKMQLIGVTGTNGKTTVSQLIAQWVALLGEKSAVLGTLGNGIYNNLTPSHNTTSSPVDIQSYLADFNQQNVKVVVMEVSSHGLALDRVKDLSFAASLFTNLSRDHLDFHQTMSAYKQAKWSLFNPDLKARAVKESGKRIINFDDDVGKEWIEQLDDSIIVSMIPENLSTIKAMGHTYLCVTSVIYHNNGASIQFSSSFGDAEIESRLFGAFNVSNLIMALVSLLELGFSFDTLVKTASSLSAVCGRMEIFSVKGQPTVIVDYAHTPDALDKALSAAKVHCEGELRVIFGCGGDRDKGKRPLMAKIAEMYTKHIIITNDNPRTEKEDAIIQDIISGFAQSNYVQIVKNREMAIQEAIKGSSDKDIVVIAGKGHEDYQIIGTEKIHYSDRETVSKLLGMSL